MATADYFLKEAVGFDEDTEPQFPLSEKTKKDIDEAVAEAGKEIEAEKEAELLKGLDEEEKLIPDEPITYNGELDGVGITLIVDFKTMVVSGSINLSGDDYVKASINGSIEMETFKVATTFSGIMGSKEHGMTAPFNGTINGVVTEDLSTFNGAILDDEGGGADFTASR